MKTDKYFKLQAGQPGKEHLLHDAEEIDGSA